MTQGSGWTDPTEKTREQQYMRKTLIALAAAAAAVTAVATPASAITRGGEPDDGAHPYVGLMVAQDADGNPLWRCSGTLISPTVYVTAGHCTEAPAAKAAIWFDEDVESGIPENGYPFVGDVAGTTHTYTDYIPEAFYFADLGVVVLDTPYERDEYAELPTEGYVDGIGKGRRNAAVTVVGYGLQKVNPVFVQAERVRLRADVMIVDTNGVAGIGNIPGSNSMVLSGDAKHGGTCFGDSGGPTLRGNVLLAVTSFGLNGNCAGIGGVYRIDDAPQLEFINGFLD